MPDSFECYRSILKEELVPALGCTEPIALAYGAAYCRSVLGSIQLKFYAAVTSLRM